MAASYDPHNDGMRRAFFGDRDRASYGNEEGAEEAYEGDVDEELDKFDEALTGWDAWGNDAETWYDCYSGEQWPEEALEQFETDAKTAIVVNDTAVTIDAISGAESGNAQETRYAPRELGDVAVNEVLTAAAKWSRDQCDAGDEETDSFLDTLICGLGACLSPDTPVVLPTGTHFTTSRLYSGDIVELHLENGKTLTGTPNHPVLTETGWKPLRLVDEGDNLINRRILERIKGLPVQQFDHVETSFEDAVNAFGAGRESLRCRTTADDFYGDGVGSKVHVVYADSALFDEALNAARLKHAKNKTLVPGHRSLGSAPLLGDGDAPASILAAPHIAPLSGRHAPRAHLSCGDVLAKLVTRAAKAIANCLGVKPYALADLHGSQMLLEVEADELRRWNPEAGAPFRRTKLVAAPLEASPDARARYSNFIADFVDCKPALEVEARHLSGGDAAAAVCKTRVLRRVVRVVADFPVHDAGTSIGFFLAADIVTSNTETRMDYDDDEEGRAVIESVSPLELAIDTSRAKSNYVNARFFRWTRAWPMEDAKLFFPGLVGDEDGGGDSDDEDVSPHHNDPRQTYKGRTRAPVGKDEVLISCYQWFKFERVNKVLNPFTGAIEELDDEELEALKEILEERGIDLQHHSERKKCWWRAWRLPKKKADAVVEKLPDDEFTVKFITGKLNKKTGLPYGAVKAMVDPQRWQNKFLVQMDRHVAVNAKGGSVLIDRGAVEDHEEFEANWARGGAMHWLEEGAIAAGAIQHIPPPAFPVTSDRLLQYSQAALGRVSGVNKEMMGLADRQQPGVLEFERKKAAFGVLAIYFRHLTRYRKVQGRLHLKLIQKYMSDGRLILINGQDGAPDRYAQLLPQVRDPNTAKFDVIVDEAPAGPNQQERVWSMLMGLGPVLKALQGLPPEAVLSILEYSPLPSSLISKLRTIAQKAMQPDPAQAQAQQAQQQMQMAEAQAKVRKTQSEAALNEARAHGEVASAQKTEVDAANTAMDVGMKRQIAQRQQFVGMFGAVPQSVGQPGMGRPPLTALQ